MERVRRGFARVRAPFGGRVFDVSLKPEDVIAIVFWTKNPAPLIPYLEELAGMGHCFTFLYTINNYPGFLEPRVPDFDHALRVLEIMSKRLGPSFFRWRYDTVVLTESLNREWHLRNFDKLCRRLAPYAGECIFSFCDYYRKTLRNMGQRVPDYIRPDEAQCRDMARELAEIADRRQIRLSACSHDFLLSDKVVKARCIDPEFLSRVADSPARSAAARALKATPTRKECGCAASRDVGAYDTCGHGCVYCYANADPEKAMKNLPTIRPDRCSLDTSVTEAGGDIHVAANTRQ